MIIPDQDHKKSLTIVEFLSSFITVYYLLLTWGRNMQQRRVLLQQATEHTQRK